MEYEWDPDKAATNLRLVALLPPEMRGHYSEA
jgi:hypothetical protein